MFVEKSIKVKDILKYNDGLVAIMNCEKLFTDDKGEKNILPRKTSYAIGRQQDYFQEIVDRVAKEKDKAKAEAENYIKTIGDKTLTKLDINNKKLEFYRERIEGLEETIEIVKMLESPLTDFGDFIVPTYSFRCLGDELISIQ